MPAFPCPDCGLETALGGRPDERYCPHCETMHWAEVCEPNPRDIADWKED